MLARNAFVGFAAGFVSSRAWVFTETVLLGLIADEVVMVDACSGVDGTWGMKARYDEQSLGVFSSHRPR